jgi:vacuolar protein sorting-associated protein 1
MGSIEMAGGRAASAAAFSRMRRATSCPMECSLLSSSDAWSCQITLRFDHDGSGRALQNLRTVSFGPLLTNKADVEIWLRRAQAAILSPHLDPIVFHTQSREDLRGMARADAQVLKFSRNAVCVEICDPDATDLAFTDLPGMLQAFSHSL